MDKKERRKKSELVIVITMILGMLVVAGLLNQVSLTSYMMSSALIEEGYKDLSSFVLDDGTPLSLDGEWLTYEGVYLDEYEVDYELLEETTLTELPISNLTDAKGTTTYRSLVKLSDEQMDLEDIVLSISHIDDTVRIYINGTRVIPYVSSREDSLIYRSSICFDLTGFLDKETDYQEIIISINDEENDTDLFKREILLSTEANMAIYQAASFIMEVFIIIIMIISVVVGGVYIFSHSNTNVLTCTILFSITLLLHIIFGMTSLPQTLLSNMIADGFGDIIFARIAKASLLLTLYLGNVLMIDVFDAKKNICKRIDKLVNTVFLFFTVASFIYPQIMNSSGVFVVTSVLALNLYSLVLKIMHLYKLKMLNNYYYYHIIKSALVGFIITIDLVTINEPTRLRDVLVVAYVCFYILVLATHGYEYQLPFSSLHQRNETLEILVEKRTKELKLANKKLREISQKDALTGAFNRLYFEEKLDKLLTKNFNSVHMCIFDIDNFKIINDTYGHSVGDEQLKAIAENCANILPKTISLFRIGGEEFAVLFVDYDDLEVLSHIERIRWQMDYDSRNEGRATGSFGVYKASLNDLRKELFINADKCLYYAKTHGKNMVVYNFDGTYRILNKWSEKKC